MPNASRAELIGTAEGYVEEHNCSYADRLIRQETSQSMGSYGIANAVLTGHVQELVKLHSDDTCPPTHVDKSPTREWADWVQDTAV